MPAAIRDEFGSRAVGAFVRGHEESEPRDIDWFATARDGLVDVELIDIGITGRIPHNRVDSAWVKRVHSDPVPAILDRRDLREAPDCPLGARIGDESILRLQAIDG